MIETSTTSDLRQNRAWILTHYPKDNDFNCINLQNTLLRDIGYDEAIVKTLYLSIDPGHRTWMREEGSYMPALTLGKPMVGGIIGKVVKSTIAGLNIGDLISGMGNWAEYTIVKRRAYSKVEKNKALPLTAYLSVLGPTGWTAYFGLLDIGRPKNGETLVVSAAAGAVGSIAGQIGKIKGCRVIGIAGSDAKCRWVTNDLGFDAAINYTSEDIEARLKYLCPEGVNLYFENIGGNVSEGVYANLADHGRVILCGLVSTYNQSAAKQEINLSPLLLKRIRIESFIVVDYFSQTPFANKQMSEWLDNGSLKYHVEVVPGIENALTAFRSLFEKGGSHSGKLLVQVAVDS